MSSAAARAAHHQAKDAEAKRKELFSLLDSSSDTPHVAQKHVSNNNSAAAQQQAAASNDAAASSSVNLNFDFDGLDDLDELDLDQIDGTLATF